MRDLVLCLLGWALSAAAWAHALRHEVALGDVGAGVVVVTLRFTDGEPFAFERYEVFRGLATEPMQTGRTSALGQLVLLPGDAAAGPGPGWRLRAFSADGHGLDTALQLASLVRHDGVAQAHAAATAHAPHWERAALGVCVILGLGLLLRQALRRRRPA